MKIFSNCFSSSVRIEVILITSKVFHNDVFFFLMFCIYTVHYYCHLRRRRCRIIIAFFRQDVWRFLFAQRRRRVLKPGEYKKKNEIYLYTYKNCNFFFSHAPAKL